MTVNDIPNELSLIFEKLNQEFFGGALPMPAIFITPTHREFLKSNNSAVIVYSKSKTQKHEFNFASSILALPIENLCAEMLHEMCHLYNHINGVKDTSRGQTYHNKRFLKTAENHGLNVAKDDTYGYAITSASVELVAWCQDKFSSAIDMFRYLDYGSDNKTYDKPNHNYRYVCPSCNTIARTNKSAHLVCGECGYTMEGGLSL